MSDSSTIIKQLDEATINKIAAGEVVERPASVVKELVENAIDAQADRIEIITAGGGKNLIRVSDNGLGMTRDDLQMAVRRHCTSKLDPDDLMDIRHLGFRGEALPSIGSIARLGITTRHASEPHAWEIAVEGGRERALKPAALNIGTRIDVKDLFFSTPARLKFLKSDRAENMAISEIIKRIAMANPKVRFTLTGEDRSRLDYANVNGPDAHLVRMGQVMGKAFRDNAVEIDALRDTVRLTGFAGLPTLNRANSLQQFVFVNGRPVRDKMMLGAIRGAYADYLFGGRHPCVVLFIDLDPHEVDVNVHPTKADVRFRDAGHIRGLVVGAIRQAIAAAGHRATNTGGSATLAALRPDGVRATEAGNRCAFWRSARCDRNVRSECACILFSPSASTLLSTRQTPQLGLAPERLCSSIPRSRGNRRGRSRWSSVLSVRSATGDFLAGNAGAASGWLLPTALLSNAGSARAHG